MQHAAGMNEGEAVALQSLHDEAFSAEDADADLLLEGDSDRHAAGRTEERVLLADQLAAERAQIHRENLAGVGRGERHALLARALVGEDRHEKAFPGEQALAGAEQRPHQPAAALRLLAAVAEDGLHADAGHHVHHRAGLGDRALARIEFHFHELHLDADDLEIDVVRAASRRRRRHRARQVRRKRRHLRKPRPLAHARGEHERVGRDVAAAEAGDDVVLADWPDLLAADRHVPLGHKSVSVLKRVWVCESLSSRRPARRSGWPSPARAVTSTRRPARAARPVARDRSARRR